MADGYTVFGIDNLNEVYDTRLKRWRLDKIKGHPHFQFHKLDITLRGPLRALIESELRT